MIVPTNVSCAKQLIKETCGYFTLSIYTHPSPPVGVIYKYYDILVVLSCSLLLEMNEEINNKYFTEAFLTENSLQTKVCIQRQLISEYST